VVVVPCVAQPQKADAVITMIPIKVIACFIPLYFTGKCAPKKSQSARVTLRHPVIPS
jgi:hypothetical protein